MGVCGSTSAGSKAVSENYKSELSNPEGKDSETRSKLKRELTKCKKELLDLQTAVLASQNADQELGKRFKIPSKLEEIMGNHKIEQTNLHMADLEALELFYRNKLVCRLSEVESVGFEGQDPSLKQKLQALQQEEAARVTQEVNKELAIEKQQLIDQFQTRIKHAEKSAICLIMDVSGSTVREW